MQADSNSPRATRHGKVRLDVSFVSSVSHTPASIDANPVSSYGSVIATHLLKSPDMASRISSVMLVDPISLLLHQPDVAYNFVCAYDLILISQN